MVRGSERSRLRILSSEFLEPANGTKMLNYSRGRHCWPCYAREQDSLPPYYWTVRGLIEGLCLEPAFTANV
jgi:hypothetical protein